MTKLLPIVFLFLIQETPQDAILKLTNAQRKTPLVANKTLAKLAQDHAENMAKQDKYGDDGKNGHILDGKEFKDRIEASDYNFTAAAENVGTLMGFKDHPKAMMDSWMGSEGHKGNIINPMFTEIGIGGGSVQEREVVLLSGVWEPEMNYILQGQCGHVWQQEELPTVYNDCPRCGWRGEAFGLGTADRPLLDARVDGGMRADNSKCVPVSGRT